jgi:hypothetical protein
MKRAVTPVKTPALAFSDEGLLDAEVVADLLEAPGARKHVRGDLVDELDADQLRRLAASIVRVPDETAPRADMVAVSLFVSGFRGDSKKRAAKRDVAISERDVERAAVARLQAELASRSPLPVGQFSVGQSQSGGQQAQQSGGQQTQQSGQVVQQVGQ